MAVDDIITELTLAEKASLVIGRDFWHTQEVPRLGVQSIMVSDGPHGLRTQLDAETATNVGGSEPATCFPTASALHAAWDRDLNRRVGAAIATEAKALGVSVVLGPGVNIKRSPLCGRNFEYISEDPHLAGELGLALVEGIQGEGVGTSVKHFAANNQETARVQSSSEVDERTLREIYLPAFERIVTAAQPWTIMCSYNKINGTWASQNHWLLTEVLRDDWGYQGLVVSDWGAVADRVAAVRAGLDLEMPPALGHSDAAVVAAVESGELSMAELDACVARVLALAERGSAIDRGVEVDFDTHDALAREAAGQGIVLLRNEGDLLPIERGTRVGVIGEFARTTRFQGGGSSQVNATRVTSALDALRELHGEVEFAAGFGMDGADPELHAEAVRLAGEVDVAVVFVGLTDAEESEGFDRPHMRLADHQVALVREVAAANPRTVVVLSNGSLVQMADWVDAPAAVLEAWLGGQAVGGAVADVLTGRVNPSGRLCETVPVRVEDNPSWGNFAETDQVRYGEGVMVGYRGYDDRRLPVVFPFGHGLSYTTFEWSDLSVDLKGSVAEGDLAATVRVQVTNTGERAGAEVVQVYVRDPQASVRRPVKELKGFAKVRLEPGTSEVVEVELDQRAFAYWHPGRRDWTVEAGEFVIEVARSARDTVAEELIMVDAPSLAGAVDIHSMAQDWLASPSVVAELRRRNGGELPGMFANEELMTVVGNFPMDRLVFFPGSGFSWDELVDVAAVAAGTTKAPAQHETSSGSKRPGVDS